MLQFQKKKKTHEGHFPGGGANWGREMNVSQYKIFFRMLFSDMSHDRINRSF